MILKLFRLNLNTKIINHFLLQNPVFQHLRHIENKACIMSFCLIFSPIFLFCQNTKEEVLLQKIEKINQSINRNLGKSELKSFLKKYKSVARKSRKSPQLSAVANAVIGRNLAQKGFHDAATKFLKRSYKCRKKQNNFVPQRWALMALIKNGEARDDYDFLLKYVKEWINLAYQNKDKLEPLYDYQWEGRDYFSEERERLLRKIHPQVWSRTRKNYRSWDKRRTYSQALLEYYFIQFPKEKEKITKEAKEFYQSVFQFKGEDDIEEMLFWKKVSTQIMKQHATPTNYAKHIRYLATLFRKKDRMFGNGMKTPKYEKLGIALMQEYVEIVKNKKDYANVLFGIRYLATRYALLKDYKQAVQHLATAIKYCRIYNKESEIVKSIGGLQTIIYKIKKSKDKQGLQAAQHWKSNYSLDGLTQEDVKRIDNLVGKR